MGFGPFSSSSSAKQTTTNQQIGVQGEGNLSVSGGLSPNSRYGNVNVSIEATDYGALDAAQNIGLEAIRGTQQTALSALETLRFTQDRANSTVAQIASDAGEVALAAAPTDLGSLADMQSKQFLLILAIIGITAGGLYYLHKTSKRTRRRK